MVSQLTEQGLDAIEVWYPYGGGGQRYADLGQADAAKLADEYELLRTGGSDCHGPGSSKFRLGSAGDLHQTLSKIRSQATKQRPFVE